MTNGATIALGEVLRLWSEPCAVEADRTYPNVGIYSFGRGLFRKPDIDGVATSATTLYRIRAGQLAYSRLFAFEGAYAIVNPEFDGCFVSNEFPCFEIDADRAFPAYIGWLFRYPRTWRALAASTTGIGSRRQRIHPERILEHRVKLPVLREQQRIAERLDEIEERTSVAHKSVSALNDEVKQAIRALIRSGGTMMACSNFLRRRPCDIIVDPEAEYRFAGVYSFGRGVFSSGKKRGREFSYRELTTIRAGDFVYPKLMAWEGALGVVPPECDGLVVSPEFPVFEIDSSVVHPVIVDTFFCDPRTKPLLHAGSMGTNLRRKRLNPDQLLQIEMPVPSKSNQRTLLVLAELHAKAAARNAATLRDLDSLLPAVLDRVFAGT